MYSPARSGARVRERLTRLEAEVDMAKSLVGNLGEPFRPESTTTPTAGLLDLIKAKAKGRSCRAQDGTR
jgi:hypothetical protein